jgi:hypothetical protein
MMPNAIRNTATASGLLPNAALNPFHDMMVEKYHKKEAGTASYTFMCEINNQDT